ncbi:ABC transporter ATP-binding protein [Amnibacterium sp. CER49]|uniref:ABC transporter ATP-binding protein n=1 Tax=Amnibacterium sp. CER49 TaxID=3039161 RepID=UPI002446F8F8|nr:ABC transporter ATP-binding protein [Amnibacterium sp. CER49]MDH2442631.1 ABC transporter ATP-binding protein [Amnibacterium sp. CER49]
MDAVIRAEGLQKRFGRVRALDGLDLVVDRGEVHGYLGPNGAGKTTTIRILLGLARATSGRVGVLGEDPWRAAAALHRRIASVPGDVVLWPNLSGGETVDLLVRLRGGRTDTAEYRTVRRELDEEFQLDPGKKARSYSKGNRQKVALIAAFAAPAELLVLDEPTSGLDPLMEEVFVRRLEAFAAGGGSVLLSSHILSEVERLCTRISIVRAGRVVESGTLAQLRHLTRTAFSFDRGDSREGALAALPGVHDLVVDDGRVRFTVDPDRIDALLPELGRLAVTGLRVAPPSLEELFLRQYGDVLEPQEA